MPNLQGQVILKNLIDGEWVVSDTVYMLPMFNRVKDFYPHVARIADRVKEEGDKIHEIVLLHARRGGKIHGYYNWDGSKLVLDKSKPADINSLFLGRGI